MRRALRSAVRPPLPAAGCPRALSACAQLSPPRPLHYSPSPTRKRNLRTAVLPYRRRFPLELEAYRPDELQRHLARMHKHCAFCDLHFYGALHARVCVKAAAGRLAAGSKQGT